MRGERQRWYLHLSRGEDLTKSWERVREKEMMKVSAERLIRSRLHIRNPLIKRVT
jgi:hypothetical protein